MQSVYDAAGGDEGLLLPGRGVACQGDGRRGGQPRLQPRLPPPAQRAARRLLGRGARGPHTYSDRYGDETAVVRIHSGNGPHEEMDQRAIACFDQALETSASPTSRCGRCCTTTSPGPPPQPCPPTTTPPTMYPKASASRAGPGTASSTERPPKRRPDAGSSALDDASDSQVGSTGSMQHAEAS